MINSIIIHMCELASFFTYTLHNNSTLSLNSQFSISVLLLAVCGAAKVVVIYL